MSSETLHTKIVANLNQCIEDAVKLDSAQGFVIAGAINLLLAVLIDPSPIAISHFAQYLLQYAEANNLKV